jgi:AraC-like DNA-binding protein/ligand-binding sensor protein
MQSSAMQVPPVPFGSALVVDSGLIEGARSWLAPRPAAATPPPIRTMVAQVQESALFRDYQRAFEMTTGLPLTVRPVGSFQLPFQASRRASPFCALLAMRNQTCAASLRAQQELEQAAMDGPRTREGFGGVAESAVPVRAGGQVVAFLRTGQVRLVPPTRAEFRRVLRQLDESQVELDRDRLATTFFETRVITRARLQSILRLLDIFAQHLSLLCQQLLVRATDTEPPAIGRARAFIAANQGEPLSLEQVARAAGMSKCYFCKIFRDRTGVSLTGYIARRRVETAKVLLVQPQARVSEVAYSAGFQSLSQFNRVFRRVTGRTPSEFHARPGREALMADP